MNTRRTLPDGCAHNAIGKTHAAKVRLANLGGSEMTKKPTNDAMYTTLELYYGPNKTLGDHLRRYYSNFRGEDFASEQYEWYDNTEAEGTTAGDLANDYWNNIEFLFANLEWEDGTNFLMEDDYWAALEVGNNDAYTP